MPPRQHADKPDEYSSRSSHDLHDTVNAVVHGHVRASDLVEAALARADGPASRHAFIRRFDDQARATARSVDVLRDAGAPLPALAGLPVSVKDLFDVAGHPTTAGSRVLDASARARTDAAAVARLRRAGAALVGHTNMTEFAFSGVGINPHFGTPANPVTAAIDATPRIPGGSTSGGAVSVATGAAWAALGSDTGGSIRIPAALQGMVGFKNTARLTPLEGCVPLSTTLDSACAITRSVGDAIVVHEVLADRCVPRGTPPLRSWRLAVATTTLLDGMDPMVARSFESAVAVLRARGAVIEEIALPNVAELAGIQAAGGFAAAESWAWHRKLLGEHAADYDPRVSMRIRRGETMSAADYLDLVQARAAWIGRIGTALAGYDAVLSPTVPIVAPPLQPLVESDDAFFATNALLLRNPSVVNMLDGCALSLPCHGAGDLPVGLMIWAPAMRDDDVLRIGLAVEAALAEARS